MVDIEALRDFRAQKYATHQLTEDGLHRLDHNFLDGQERMHELVKLFPPRLHREINNVLKDHQELTVDFARNIGCEIASGSNLGMTIHAYKSVSKETGDKPILDRNSPVGIFSIGVYKIENAGNWKDVINIFFDIDLNTQPISIEKEGWFVNAQDVKPIQIMASLVELVQGLSTYMPELRQGPKMVMQEE